jgi:uncharacterized RDD family membrane protein YckC
MKRLLLVILMSLLLVQSVMAQDAPVRLPAASDSTLHWLLVPVAPKAIEQVDAPQNVKAKTPPYQILLNMAERDELDTWAGITQIRGDLQATSLAAYGQDLFVVFEQAHVYRLQRQDPPPGTMLRDVVKMVVQPKLPVEGLVTSAVANDKGYHVILEPKMTVERLVDNKQTADDPRLLLSLHRNQWTQAHLPDVVLDWQALQLIPVGRDRKLAYAGQSQGKVFIATLQDEHWKVQELQFEPTMHDQLSWFNIDGHLLMTRYDMHFEHMLVQVNLIVDDRVLELGKFDVSTDQLSQWALLTLDQKIGFVTVNEPDNTMSLRTLDFQGNQPESPIEIAVGNPVNDMNQPGRWIVLAAMMAGILLFLSVWHRNPATAKVTPPQGYEVAAISKRFLALMIDLAPCGFISSTLFGMTMQELVDQWPGMAITWEQLLPGLVTIAFYTTHTTLFEIFTAQTLGKKIMGISVCTMDGKSPDVWQVILRNLLKVLDLIAWYVLPIFVIISAYRQRLGDIVARTVVIQPKPLDFDE